MAAPDTDEVWGDEEQSAERERGEHKQRLVWTAKVSGALMGAFACWLLLIKTSRRRSEVSKLAKSRFGRGMTAVT